MRVRVRVFEKKCTAISGLVIVGNLALYDLAPPPFPSVCSLTPSSSSSRIIHVKCSDSDCRTKDGSSPGKGVHGHGVDVVSDIWSPAVPM